MGPTRGSRHEQDRLDHPGVDLRHRDLVVEPSVVNLVGKLRVVVLALQVLTSRDENQGTLDGRIAGRCFNRTLCLDQVTGIGEIGASSATVSGASVPWIVWAATAACLRHAGHEFLCPLQHLVVATISIGLGKADHRYAGFVVLQTTVPVDASIWLDESLQCLQTGGHHGVIKRRTIADGAGNPDGDGFTNTCEITNGIGRPISASAHLVVQCKFSLDWIPISNLVLELDFEFNFNELVGLFVCFT